MYIKSIMMSKMGQAPKRHFKIPFLDLDLKQVKQVNHLQSINSIYKGMYSEHQSYTGLDI